MDWITQKIRNNKDKKLVKLLKQGEHYGLASQIRTSIFSATRVLVKHPLSGQIEESLGILQQGHRYIVDGNYTIIYLMPGSKIYITDIFDCRQNPKKMSKRAKK